MDHDNGNDGLIEVERVVRGVMMLIALVVCGDVLTLIIRTTGHDNLVGIVPLLDVNEEANIPTFIAALLWVWTGMAMAGVAFCQGSRLLRWVWMTWALIAGYMAFDELFSIHEHWKAIGTALAHRLFGSDIGNMPYIAWTLAAAIPVVGVSAMSLVVMRRLESVLRIRLVVAGVCFVSGAFGLELLEGAWLESHDRDLVFHGIVLVEEFLEMTAVLLALRACLLELRRLDIRVRLR